MILMLMNIVATMTMTTTTTMITMMKMITVMTTMTMKMMTRVVPEGERSILVYMVGRPGLHDPNSKHSQTLRKKVKVYFIQYNKAFLGQTSTDSLQKSLSVFLLEPYKAFFRTELYTLFKKIKVYFV